MTTELTIQAADNGMMVSGEDFARVIEETHEPNGQGRDNLIRELGEIMHGEIMHAMEKELADRVEVTITITKKGERR